MAKTIIYVTPNCDVSIDEIHNMYKNGELLKFAEEEEECFIYHSIESFASDFNSELISDLGWMFVV